MTRLLVAALVVLAPWSQPSGRIAGHVATHGDPGSDLRRAYVSLVSTNSATRRMTMTGDDGTFAFDDVPPGEYVVQAGKLPHVAESQRVVLAQGQSRTGLTFRLRRAGAISGIVYDEQGRPVRDMNVSALRIRYERGGAMTTTAAGRVATDRFGRYRIFGLPPGSYVIVTGSSGLPPPGATTLTDAEVERAMQGIVEPRRVRPAGSSSPQFSALLQFVPGVTRAEAATVFRIEEGTEHNNVSATLLSAPALNMGNDVPGVLAGVVLGPDGQAVEADVSLSYAPWAITGGSYLRGSKGSRFVFNDVLPGALRLIATVSGTNLRAELPVTMSGERLTDITLRALPPVTVTGRAVDIVPPTSRMIVVKPSKGGMPDTHGAQTDEAGHFRITLHPGSYVIEGGTSVSVDGRDVTDREIAIGHDVPPRNLTVSFAEVTQGLSGRVTNGEGAGVSTVTMVAFSTLEADWFHPSRRIAAVTPSPDGRYQLGGTGASSLPAGEYYLAAVTALSADEQYNPTFLRTLVDAALKVTVAPGHLSVQDVRVK